MKMFQKREKLKYRVDGNVFFADKIELNRLTGQTILYMGDTIVFIAPKEMAVQQTYDQTSCANSAKTLNYDIKENLSSLRKKEQRTEADDLMIRFLYKMEEYLDHISGDLFHDYCPKKIEKIYR